MSVVSNPESNSAARVPDFEAECVSFFAEVVQILGVPPSVGQIYGLLYAAPGALSFTDIVERLEISKGSASQGLQLLRSLGAVYIVEGADRRREYFEPELGLRRLVSGVLRERLQPFAVESDSRLARMRALAEREGPEQDFCQERVRQLETWRKQLRLVLPILGTLLNAKSR